MYSFFIKLFDFIFSSTGFFFQNPWAVHVVLLIALTLIATHLPIPKKNRIYFILILYFFPPTQLLIKSFNPHAYNVTFSLLAMIFFIDIC
ncbi:MAG: hypothetical protein COB02_02270 [Candidatus Cloacimonadota bacterium]|nr:MAG: hypothetical protein COB02_02270 [Candidatus Cloacimonadota bacterium]